MIAILNIECQAEVIFGGNWNFTRIITSMVNVKCQPQVKVDRYSGRCRVAGVNIHLSWHLMDIRTVNLKGPPEVIFTEYWNLMLIAFSRITVVDIKIMSIKVGIRHAFIHMMSIYSEYLLATGDIRRTLILCNSYRRLHWIYGVHHLWLTFLIYFQNPQYHNREMVHIRTFFWIYKLYVLRLKLLVTTCDCDILIDFHKTILQ